MTHELDEPRKVQSALYTMIATDLSGKTQEAFHAREDLRTALDLIEGRLVPVTDDAPRLTGIPGYYRECMRNAYRILGAPVPTRIPLPSAH